MPLNSSRSVQRAEEQTEFTITIDLQFRSWSNIYRSMKEMWEVCAIYFEKYEDVAPLA